jgi:S-adenosylmethionine-diacylgycerolhomoserine-N-methlytransferase
MPFGSNQMVGPIDELARHRRFLNRYYGISRSFYDATRKYFLFGRDGVLDELLSDSWDSLVEVGPGTARNLRKLHAKRPQAAYGGIEPCDAMRDHASAVAPWARLVDAFAEEADYCAVLGHPPDRILFSYSLSMVGDPGVSLARAIDALRPGGEVVVVDFGTMDDLPSAARGVVRGLLAAFHVRPVDLDAFDAKPYARRRGPFGYYASARYSSRSRSA